MSEFASWAQSNWYTVGTLLIELSFLVAAVWFARNILGTLRAFQEQVGALLRLSITSAPTDLHPAAANAKPSFANASPYWLTPSETPVVSPPEPADSGPNQFVVAWQRLISWLQEPMRTSEAGRWRRVINWLQAPAGN
ncbi:MAG: hypothetical protein WCE61_14615 [Candidatus Acidiferrum sp.]